jgi:chemotaxis protein methyltransferase CheR
MNINLNIYNSRLSEHDFNKISQYIERNYGIKLPQIKHIMVQNRLFKRLKATGFESFDTYIKYVFSNKGAEELKAMVDEITTNKTDFFREASHFNFFEKYVLKNFPNPNIWSAGCSTGEEPYTIAMLLYPKTSKYSILATDLSYKVIQAAKKAEYDEYKITNLDKELINKYFNIINKKNRNYYQIKPFLKKNIQFQQLNLLAPNYNINKQFDTIFFRNVLIYFSRETQNNVLNKIINYLKPNGYLFLGHSETIYNYSLPLKSVNPSVYKKI